MPPAVTVEACRVIHTDERNRLDGEFKGVWKAITNLRVEQTKLAVKVGILTGGIAALPGVVALLLGWFKGH